MCSAQRCPRPFLHIHHLLPRWLPLLLFMHNYNSLFAAPPGPAPPITRGNIRYDTLLLRFTRKMTRNLNPYPVSPSSPLWVMKWQPFLEVKIHLETKSARLSRLGGARELSGVRYGSGHETLRVSTCFPHKDKVNF